MTPKFTLVATMRNEGPFLLEWLAYHRAIGFTDFVVCSNDCVDGSAELLDRLEDACVLGHIRCDPAPDDKPQLVAYETAARWLDPSPDEWLMVLDADEFLNIHVGGGTVPDLVAAVPDATAFHINWRVFGSSGHERWSPEPVTERFTRAAARENGVNWSFKTLFRRADAYDCMLQPHGPAFARSDYLSALVPVDGAGERLPEEYARAESFLQLKPARWDLAQVNHYNTRSWEDYLVKHHRTGGLFQWERDPNWAAFDRNEEQDLSIRRHLPALRRQLGELLQLPGVADARQRCLALYGAHVDVLKCAESAAA